MDRSFSCSGTKVLGCRIESDNNNKRDHHPISAVVQVTNNGKYVQPKRVIRSHHLCVNQLFRNKYTNRLNRNLSEIFAEIVCLADQCVKPSVLYSAVHGIYNDVFCAPQSFYFRKLARSGRLQI